MANNKSILIKYGSEEVIGTTGGLVPSKKATLNTSGHVLENDITVEFPGEYVIPEGEIEITSNNTTVNVAGKATANVQIEVPDVSGVDASASNVLEGKTFYGKNGKQLGTLPLLAGHTFTLYRSGDSTDLNDYVLVPASASYTCIALTVGDSGHVTGGVTVSLENLAWDKSFTIN